jgi:hypothetical protein
MPVGTHKNYNGVIYMAAYTKNVTKKSKGTWTTVVLMDAVTIANGENVNSNELDMGKHGNPQGAHIFISGGVTGTATIGYGIAADMGVYDVANALAISTSAVYMLAAGSRFIYVNYANSSEEASTITITASYYA